jgi:hypothetical protein
MTIVMFITTMYLVGERASYLFLRRRTSFILECQINFDDDDFVYSQEGRQ